MIVSKYRITKEGGSKNAAFFIEKRSKFLWWSWWSKLNQYVLEYDITCNLSFKTYKEAYDHIMYIKGHKVKKVCTYFNI